MDGCWRCGLHRGPQWRVEAQRLEPGPESLELSLQPAWVSVPQPLILSPLPWRCLQRAPDASLAFLQSGLMAGGCQGSLRSAVWSPPQTRGPVHRLRARGPWANAFEPWVSGHGLVPQKVSPSPSPSIFLSVKAVLWAVLGLAEKRCFPGFFIHEEFPRFYTSKYIDRGHLAIKFDWSGLT